jgi:hypothetical protein
MLYKRKEINQLPIIDEVEVKYYPGGSKTVDDAQTYIKDGREFNREVASVTTEIKTPAGLVTAEAGDYILIDNSNGEQWVCSAASFNDVFEEVV